MKTPDIYKLTDDHSKIRVLVDTDILLEFFINRMNFAEDAEKLQQLLLNPEYSPFYEVYVTSKCFRRICYELSESDSDIGEKYAADLKTKGVEVIPINENLRQKARISSLRDFDSAEELACANAMNLGAIITLNPQNFDGANLPIWSVSEFWDRVQLQKVLSNESAYAKVHTEEILTHAKVHTEEILTHAKVHTEEILTHAKVHTEEKPTHAKVYTEEKPTNAKVYTKKILTLTVQTTLQLQQTFVLAGIAAFTTAIIAGLSIDE